jgi:hypothetical protein
MLFVRLDRRGERRQRLLNWMDPRMSQWPEQDRSSRPSRLTFLRKSDRCPMFARQAAGSRHVFVKDIRATEVGPLPPIATGRFSARRVLNCSTSIAAWCHLRVDRAGFGFCTVLNTFKHMTAGYSADEKRAIYSGNAQNLPGLSNDSEASFGHRIAGAADGNWPISGALSQQVHLIVNFDSIPSDPAVNGA